MDKKTFKWICKECICSYGFAYYSKKFFLVLPNIIVRLQYMPYPHDSGLMLSYDIIVKKLSNNGLNNMEEINNAFDDISEIPVQMPVLQNLEVMVGNNFVNIFAASGIKEEEWKKNFLQTLHNTFDLFKEDDIQRLKEVVFDEKSKDHLIVNQKVKNFLCGTNNY